VKQAKDISSVDLSFKTRKSLQPLPLEEPESAPAAWLNQAHASNVSVDDTIIRYKAFYWLLLVQEYTTLQVPMTELTGLRGDTTLFTELPQVKAGMLIQKQ
jgi:hypothetical protein